MTTGTLFYSEHNSETINELAENEGKESKGRHFSSLIANRSFLDLSEIFSPFRLVDSRQKNKTRKNSAQNAWNEKNFLIEGLIKCKVGVFFLLLSIVFLKCVRSFCSIDRLIDPSLTFRASHENASKLMRTLNRHERKKERKKLFISFLFSATTELWPLCSSSLLPPSHNKRADVNSKDRADWLAETIIVKWTFLKFNIDKGFFCVRKKFQLCFLASLLLFLLAGRKTIWLESALLKSRLIPDGDFQPTLIYRVRLMPRISKRWKTPEKVVSRQ